MCTNCRPAYGLSIPFSYVQVLGYGRKVRPTCEDNHVALDVDSKFFSNGSFTISLSAENSVFRLHPEAFLLLFPCLSLVPVAACRKCLQANKIINSSQSSSSSSISIKTQIKPESNVLLLSKEEIVHTMACVGLDQARTGV